MGGHSGVRVNRVECNQAEADVGTQVRKTRLKLGKAHIVRVHLCMLKYMLQLYKVQRGREGDRGERKEIKKKVNARRL